MDANGLIAPQFGSYARATTNEFIDGLKQDMAICKALNAPACRIWPGTADSEDTDADLWMRVIADLKEAWGNEHRIFFIIGADTLPILPTWRRPGDLVDQADFLTAARPGYPIDCWKDLSVTFSREQVRRLKQGCIDTLPVGISSTEVRRLISMQKTIRYLVPMAVEAYIYKHGLYGARKEKQR